MTLPPDGFLSPDIQETIARVRKNFPDWFELIGRLNRLAMRVMPKIDVPVGDKQKFLEAVHFARAVQSLQAAVLLLERGMEADARNALRSATETTILLVRVSRDPALAERLVENDDYHRQKMAGALLRDAGAMATMSPERKEALEKTAADIKARYTPAKPRPLNIADEAIGDALVLYNLVFRPTSNDAAHTSLESLVRHFIERKDGSAFLQFGPRMKSAKDTLDGVATIFVFALHVVFSRAVLTEHEAEGNELTEEWKRVSKATTSPGGGPRPNETRP